MKKVLYLLILLTAGIAQLKAQEANKFRFDIRIGYTIPTNADGGGILLHIEPKWTIADHINVGLRLGAAVYAQGLDGVTQGSNQQIGASGSYVGTYDYYFHNGSSSFAPFVGGGLGYYQVANVNVDDSNLEDNTVIKGNGKFGGLIRAGFDAGKFRLAAEYNIIGKSDLVDVNNNIIGTAKNGYIGISVGAYFGGGKWRR